MLKEKYSQITFKILLVVPIVFAFFAVDRFILPQKHIKDEITKYQKIEVKKRSSYGNNSTAFLGYKYYTAKGFEFSVSKSYLPENEIIISQSYIFQTINKVTSQNKDYSNELSSGLNGICFYVALALLLVAVTSLLLLKFNTALSENGFQNIILSNSFLTIWFLYLLFLFN